MMLVIGGMYSGKTEYVKALGYSDADIASDINDGAPVLTGLQDIVRAEPEAASALLPRLLEYDVVICDEVGGGVVPLAPEDRRYREAVGRLCIKLAEGAEKVVRVTCGVPQVIKG